MALRSYRDLVTWQRAMDLVTLVYDATRRFPREEAFVLTSQIRRAATSIPTNLAEGYGRQSRRDYVRFLDIARGSLQELDTLIEIARRLGYLEPSTAERLSDSILEVGRLLAGLLRSLRPD